jgi:hypothetical protein
MRLYFFPYRERPIKELERELRRFILIIAGLVAFCLILFVCLLTSANSVQILAAVGFLAVVCVATIIIVQLVKTKIIPLKEKLQNERSASAREQSDLQRNPPPSEEEYEAWINDIANEVYYNIAPKKLQLPENPGSKSFGDLSIRAIVRPSQANPPAPWNTEAARIWAKRLHKWHYSIYIFTRLFVLEDYIAIYTDRFNVLDPTKTEEKSEHCFHQHVSYVSLDVQSEAVEVEPGRSSVSLNQQLSLALDSGYTIKLDVADARFLKRIRGHSGEYLPLEPITDTNNVHKGLLEVLNDHKKSMLRSFNEHE